MNQTEKQTFRRMMLVFLMSALAAEAVNAATGTRTIPVPTVPPPTLPGLSPEMTYTMATLSFGGIAGWSVGFTLKKFAKAAALVLGIVFMAIQGLAYNHFLTVNWTQIQKMVPEPTIQNAWMSLMSVFTYNFPFAGAFIAGAYLGFSKG